MTVLTSSALALIFAYCFAAVSRLLLRCDVRTLQQWNQAFLTGLSLTGVVFIPLSMLLPRNALAVTAVLLVVVGMSDAWRRFRGRGESGRGNARQDLVGDLASNAFLFLTGIVFLQFVVENGRFSFWWDGYQIWGTKALLLHHHGALGTQWVTSGEQERIVSYPHLVPLFQALIPEARGIFEWNDLKPVFAIFFASLLVSTFGAAREIVPRKLAAGATALLALAPAVSTRFSVGGYADMPQAAFVAGAIAALLAWRSEGGTGWRSPVPWLIGGVIFVKGEGIILASIICGAVFVCWLLAPNGTLLSRLSKHRTIIAVTCLCFAMRYVSLVWLSAPDATYGPLDRAHLTRAVDNGAAVVTACLHEILKVSEWGVFWPAFFIAAGILAVMGSLRERALVGATVTALIAYTSIFLFTNWDILLHINQAYSRLLVQIAPSASVVIVAAYARVARIPEEG